MFWAAGRRSLTSNSTSEEIDRFLAAVATGNGPRLECFHSKSTYPTLAYAYAVRGNRVRTSRTRLEPRLGAVDVAAEEEVGLYVKEPELRGVGLTR